MSLHLKPGQLTLADLRQAYLAPVRLSLDPSADAPIAASVACVENIIAEGRTAYGINTGFGLLASTRISPADLEKLQRSIVLSHAAGVGEALDDAMVRLVMLLKVNSLARGFSGIRRKVIDALIALINAEVYPHIPLKGSVGASGDLAPLAHMSLVLIGESRARHRGEWLPAAEALAVAGLEPLTLAAKEGLALLNGTQVSTAYALRGLFEAEDLFAAATVCGGLSVEAMLGSRAPFDARIHAARGQRGQIDVAAAYRDLLTASSEVARSHEKCDKVQDPYSLRCQPQVMGACLTQMRQAAEVLEIEANAVSDNPLVFAAEGDVISGGNFHAEPVAMAADNLALALADRFAVGTAHLADDGHAHVAVAAVPGGQRRGQLRLHDRPGHRRRAGQRQQGPGPPGQRRQPADLGQPGRPCVDGAERRQTALGDGRERPRDSRRGVAGCLPGPGLPRGPEEFSEAGAGSPPAARQGAVLPGGSLLRP